MSSQNVTDNKMTPNSSSPTPKETASQNINYSPKSAEGINALMLACQQSRLEEVQKILKKKGSDSKERTRSGKVALHFCAESGSVSCTEQLIVADRSLINAQDEEGYTPLHLAVINGNKDIVHLLISAGADLNCFDNERHSLVHWATVEILELLISNGAPASTPDIHRGYPIHYAAQMCGSSNGVSSVSHARVRSTIYGGVSPKKGLQILKRLLKFGCPVDVKDQDGRQPLLWAASAGGVHFHQRKYERRKHTHKPFSFMGSSDAILLLMNAGAKVDTGDRDGLTALHCAASRGHTDCAETLIGLCGSEVDTIDHNGCTPLFYSVTLGHADCTELLLKYGSEPNQQDRKGRTPSHCGAAKGQLETLKLLAKHGGNLWLRNVRGDLPLHEAILSKRKDLVSWLLSLKQDVVNTTNNDGRSPIHLAALNNNVEMVKILIDHHADINILMRSGKGTAMTPLDAAIHKGNSEVAKFLQLHGGLPSNSLNDAALHRRLNRSVLEGQVSPVSVHGSYLSSQNNNHPSPEYSPHGIYMTPDPFDPSLAFDSRTDFSKAASFPPIATSTPIMDDSVQTDSKYMKDTEVQVSDDFDGKNGENSTHSHRKLERRRRRKSRSVSNKNGTGSTSTSPDRTLTKLTARGSRKSSRASKSTVSSRSSGEKVGRTGDSLVEEPAVLEKSPMTPQGSSDTLLEQENDNTLMSEKFSELENVAVQSSETDVREEELDGETETGDRDVEQTESKTRSKSPSVQKKGKSQEGKSKSEAQTPASKSTSRKMVKESALSCSGASISTASPDDTMETADKVKDIRNTETERTKPEKEGERRSRSKSTGKEAPKILKDEEIVSNQNARPLEGVEENKASSKGGTRSQSQPPSPDVPQAKDVAENNSRDDKYRMEENESYSEIEAGKQINLQEAARRRSESLARDPSRARSRSISLPKHSCNKMIPASSIEKRTQLKNSKSKHTLNPHHSDIPTTSEEREIKLQEALLASSKNRNKAPLPPHGNNPNSYRRKITRNSSGAIRKSSEELNSNSTIIDSGFSDARGMTTTSTSDEFKTRLSPEGKQLISMRRRVVTRRLGSPHQTLAIKSQRKSIFSSSPKQYRAPATLVVHQMSIENGLAEDEAYSTSTRGGSVTSEEGREDNQIPRRRRTNYSRPRSKLTFSRNDNTHSQSPKPKKDVNVETSISVTQAMQASMRKYNLERKVFHELLELKRLQLRAGKSNEQLLVRRLAENYKRAGYSVNYRDFEGPFTFRNFEKYLYDQLRLLQSNRKVLPRFAPSDDIEKLSTALKKMNSTKLPYLEDAERAESVCENVQCSHTTHRCHHAAHAYTGVPCAAYLGNRKNGFLPRVNPLKAPGPTQIDAMTRSVMGSRMSDRPMQISISPRTDTQSPITLEVQQGSNTQVFTLPTKTLDPSKNYYVSLSIKPNHGSPSSSPTLQTDRPRVEVDDGSISAPPPPAHNDGEIEDDRDKHNRSM